MSMDALHQDEIGFDSRNLRYYSPDFISGHLRIPKTYKITKENLTLEDVSLILRMWDVSITDTHPLFNQAVKQGLIDVPV
ncbi:hypothetical protein phiAS5_ORF0255 [Aeromonas phage phiAS5]|uniref:Uncharacterized protein n=1 Tax=Aeromonas phage phiAS5 TaxID=879630 RepID=E1A209_9CAUD|nr:hypothetical protein phiAS5_ORF0255 [Aeromonas phage phiAS5]ADM80098.1 hypothetical protein phiAS5_ORF0255 [Aeromonas phage phiAS5]